MYRAVRVRGAEQTAIFVICFVTINFELSGFAV
jgi:hypothetical protein